MPNWVYNTVSIDTEENAKKVFAFMKTENNDFDYDQVTNDWGVKWNAGDVDVYGEGVTFISPWDHPHNVLFQLSLKFPDVEFEVYWEEEQGFGEDYSIMDGSKTLNRKWDTPEHHEYTGADGYEIRVLEFTSDNPNCDGEVGFFRQDESECYTSLEAATVGWDRKEKLKNYKNKG